MSNRIADKVLKALFKEETKMTPEVNAVENVVNINILYPDDTYPRLVAVGGEYNSAAYDLYTAEQVLMEPGQFKIIPLGVVVETPVGYRTNIKPKSSTFKKWGLLQTNPPGLVDPSYRGKDDRLGLPVVYMGKEPILIPKHTPICQMDVDVVTRIRLVPKTLGEWNDNENRGGFGTQTAKNLNK
ncbi:MAG: deoxyuridine 5'-triphosphate nucleotidohydrolase [Paraclostridium sp.]